MVPALPVAILVPCSPHKIPSEATETAPDETTSGTESNSDESVSELEEQDYTESLSRNVRISSLSSQNQMSTIAQLQILA
uniref:Uncharacterized protein n=2 Tax=Canis lupus TaxID=9612 RepID=A0A8I3NXI2_CANLF